MTRRLHSRIGILVLLLVMGGGGVLRAGEIARADLDILGLGLEVDRQPVITAVDVPAYVQTIFGGKTNDDAPSTPGLSAMAELTGPGLGTPITLAAIPGRKFALPALHEKGEYSLQNIRLVGENGVFLQQAVPSFAVINVTDVLKTEVRARQLTPQELRERGITVDARNFDVYEYTIILGVGENRVEIPYPVIVDKRTNQVEQLPPLKAYKLPPLSTRRPPRYSPPQTDYFSMSPGPSPSDPQKGVSSAAPSIPAAIVLPTGFGVLHQYFAVILQVSNGAPDGSNIRIDSINAAIGPPQQMRVAKVTPAVTIGQPVPIHDDATGATFLVAGAQGQAEWTLEALKTGTHTIDVTVEGTYQKPGQEDVPLRGHVSTSVIVSDPRFQINFSHPDVVRVDEPYTAYAFVTNLSPQAQHVALDMSQIPECSTGGAVDNVCRLEGSGMTELDIQPGEMVPVPYKLTSKITGNVFAAAGSANDETIGVSVQLHMGVSESGIPLSAATLVMPHYARYLPSEFLAANMQLLGLGYSLATAPLNPYTAKFPRVIRTDVYQRAQDITRAGQRIFVTRASRDVNDPEENRDACFHLALDLLGNVERIDQTDIAPELTEWDDLRQMEKSGRRAGAAMARQLEIHGLHNSRTPQQFVDDFAAATSHRSPFLFAYVHGADVAGQERPYALSLLGVTTNRRLDVPAEATAGWVRTMPFSELTRFDAGTERGEMALLGRVSENIRVRITPQASSFTLHLIYPDTANGAFLRTDVDISGATPGQTVWIDLARGWRTPVVNGASGTAIVREVPQTPLRVLGAAQDLYADAPAHLVSILFNRPLYVADVLQLRDRIALTTNVPKANYTVTRRNTPADPNAALQVPSAALQEDGKLINVTFDKALSKNADYTIAAESLVDLVTRASFSDTHIVPRIDNDRPGAILTGLVLDSDGTPMPNVPVELTVEATAQAGPQIDLTNADGRFLYEFVERDIDRGINGFYNLRAVSNGRETKVTGAVRVVSEVHTVNLVFLGRGVVRGHVRYDDGTPVPKINVQLGSLLQHERAGGIADDDGYYEIGGVAVGPITIAAYDGATGVSAFAATVMRTAGEVVTQDLVMIKREYHGSGTVRVTVRRADNNNVVPEASVAVQTSGYSLYETFTDQNGVAEFTNVPAGLVSIIAAHFGISRESYSAIEIELKADQVLDQPILLPVSIAPAYSNLSGVITRDDPTAPSDRTKDQVVPGAIITLGPLPPVTADANGAYVYPDVPPSLGEPRFQAKMLVFDPATGRKGQFDFPTLLPGDVHYSVRLSSTEPEGYATVRVRLTSAAGVPVTGYKVMEPGFPPAHFTAKGNGVYELTGVQVPNHFPVVAVPAGSDGTYGDQMAQGTVRVDFNGQVAVLDLRLPGQGNVIAKVELRQPDGACPVAPCYAPAIGRVVVQSTAWDEFEQHPSVRTQVANADPVTQLNTFQKIPAQQLVAVYTDQNPAGFAGVSTTVGYDGDVRTVTLRLETIGDVTGRVFAHDRQTPIAGALVKLQNGAINFGAQVTKADGSFHFPAVPAALAFTIVAETSRDGIYRTGSVEAKTPAAGGPVGNLVVVMREQSTIEGQIVDLDGHPVPLARYWARELWWPARSFGTYTEPLQADINGRFVIQNVFSGPFRITGISPTIQEVRGDYQGTIGFEGDTSQQNIQLRIGGVGTGSLSVSVVDSLQAFKAMPNTEVTIYRGSDPFDVGSTDDRGIVEFHDVIAGTYSVGAFSKTVGRAGRVDSVPIVANETTTRQIALEFLGKVSGDVIDPVTDPPNGPAKGAAVQVESTVSLRETTDSEGKFTMLGIPEGPFRIYAYDYETGRIAFGPSGLFISKIVQEHNDIHLELERMATLRVKAYLPNDAGGPGELAPLAAIEVSATDYLRAAQGNDLVFPRMIPRYGYKVVAQELGGESRRVVAYGSFPPNTFEHTQSVVFPASGTVEVRVLDGSGQPVSDAEVKIRDTAIFTTVDGMVTLSGVSFGEVWVQAKKGSVGASASGNLQSRSVPLRFVLNLGSSASIAGFVEGEVGTGIPSVGTRVVMNVTSSIAGPSRLEALTGADGTFLFGAVPIGNTHLSFLYYGPDDTTIGAERIVDVPNGTTGTYTVPPVKLDATPPRVVSIDPPANTNNVSPSSNVVVTFSEPISASFLNTNSFQLISTDNNAQVGVSLQPSIRPDGTFQVKLIPPAPPAGQRFPLKSNVLYRVVINAGIQDTTGNALVTTVGSSFTTVNYTEPSVVRIDPQANQPLPSNTTLRIKFNKQIDLASLDPGNGGVVKLEKLSTRGGTPVREVALARSLDVTDPTVIVAGVTGESIEEASFYRLTVSGIRDTQTPPNAQTDAKIVDFFSFDTKRPLATIVSPVAAGETLITDVFYTAQVSVVDEITGATSTDIDSVDWFDANGQFLRRVSTPPFAFSFVAPATATYTLQVSANDLSGNTSPSLQSFTWNVTANAAPANVVVTNTPASAYPTQSASSTVTFTDEGLQVTVALELHAKKLDGTDAVTILGSKAVARTSTTAAWPVASFNYTLPLDVQAGAASIVAKVSDLAKTGTGQAPLEILNDDIAPEVVAFVPAGETRYPFDATYTIELQVRDAQTGLKSATISVGGIDVPAAQITHTVANGVHTYRTTARVPAKNADTRVAIVARATDNRDNVTTSTAEVIYERVDDASIPQAAWVTPLDQAAIPFGIAGWQTTLRIRATDDSQITSVEFISDAFASPVAAVTSPKSGTTDIFEAKATFTLPANGLPFVVTALIHDAEPNHTVELPITLDPVVLDPNVPAINTTSSISSITAPQYVNKPLVVRGAGVRVTITVPLAVRDLIILDGATVSTFEETKLDLTIAEHLFIDADSKIDVSDKGYLGAHRVAEDNVLRNDSDNGRTLGGAIGAKTSNGESAAGSYGGIGGEMPASLTNATYGSITAPRDLGSGGSGTGAAGNGGGAALLSGANARFAVAGGIFGDGGTGVARHGAGSGGTVSLDARMLITGPLTRITANGGDDDASATFSNGGGGGRLAVRISDRFDATEIETRFRAHGGRNGTSDGAELIDGGAGTFLLARPGSTSGELIVSSHDARQPSSTHRTRGTVLGGTIAVDAITIGPRALARIDTEQTAPMTIDASALVVGPADLPQVTLVSSVPAAGANVAQSTTITPTFTATSLAGITRARVVLTAQPSDTVVNLSAATTSVPNTPAVVTVPSSAPLGATSLKIVATDRAGRTVETAPVTFTIVSNAAPVIDSFVVTPSDSIYAGGTIDVTSAASDDVEVKSLALASSVGTVTSQSATKPTPQSMMRAFSVALSKTTPSGMNVVLTLTAADDFPNRVPTTSQHTVTVRRDDVAPIATIATPTANQQFDESSTGTFAIDVLASDAEVGVNTIVATFEGAQYTLLPVAGQPGRYSVANVPIPAVDGTEPVAKTITVAVTDFEPNTTTTSVTILVKPLIDPNAPKLNWICSSPNAMYPAGYAVPLRVFAEGSSTQNGVQRVELSINGGAAIPATETSTGSKEYLATFAIPSGAAAGAVYTVRAAAVSTSGNEATLLGTITVVAGVDITTTSDITATDAAFENLTLIVRSGGVLTITGPHTFANLVVLDGGKVVQKHLDLAKADTLTLDRLYVACNATVDVTAQGFAPRATYPGETAAAPNGGAAHIGLGGSRADSGTTYGSIYRPREAGAGEFNRASGGGIVRIAATRVTIDGTIFANGQSNSTSFEGGAAGGSIWIAATTIRGSGRIEANGGNGAGSSSSNGGAGAIAIESADAASALPTLQARSGNSNNPYGGAGSIYTRGPQSVYGDLRFDNSGIPMERPAVLPAFGTAVVQSVPAAGTIVLAAPASVKPYFAGHWLRVQTPDGTTRGIWRIASVTTSTQLVLENNTGNPVDVRAGDTVRGAYRFDTLALINAWVETSDLVLVTTAPVLDATSRLYTGNDAAPAVQTSLISFAMGTNGPLLVGQPNAVVDPDQPIDVSARNTTRPLSTPTHATASSDGSFTLTVEGAPGDPILLTAHDSHHYPLSSEIAIGTIPADMGVASMTFNPNPATGGRTSVGTVTLSRAAPAGGAVIQLHSDSSSAVVPALVTIPVGQTSATFNVTTTAVTAPLNVTVTATWGATPTNAVLALVLDNIPPIVTITAPAANAQFTEGAAAGIPVQVTIVEEDSGLAQATVTLDGVTKNLVRDVPKGADVYTATLATPFVEGTSPVPMSVVVTAVDNNGNTETRSVPVVINPVVDSNPPTVAWTCASSIGVVAVGDAVSLRVVATAPNSTNFLRSVQFFITDPNGVPSTLVASALPNNEYQVVYTIPAVADGAQFSVRAVATTVAGTTAEVARTFIAVADAVKIQFGTTINANTTTYEGKSLVLAGGTTTINGAHSFKRLIIYSGATVTHATGDALNVQAEDVFVACGGTIDVNGRGFVGNTTYPGATPAGANSGGSHMGYGGLAPSSSLASTYGSVYHPIEAGFGGSLTTGGATSATGGGVVRITATTFTHDGVIRANGTDTAFGGSGGSVWIKTTTLAGTGIIQAGGGTAQRGGGGGAIAIEYATATGSLIDISAVGGGSGTPGGPGTILIKPASLAYGNLTIDNDGLVGQGTELPALGSGVALNTVTGATLVTDRAADVPAYFSGHWVRVSTAAGVVKGTWKIGAIDHKSVTLTPNGNETIDVQNGDRWQGIYRFDSVALRNTTLISLDPIETTEETIDGTVTTSSIRTTNLRIHPNGLLTHPVGGKLDIAATGEVRIEAGGSIDTNGKGYISGASYPGAAVPTSNSGLGGSHIGRGGQQNNTANLTYGSVYQPQELGAASAGTSTTSTPGGGAIRINAATVLVDGAIRASGPQGSFGGAGGSVWITSTRISGNGTIETNGGNATSLGIGAGGAIAIEYSDGSSTLPALFSRTGADAGSARYGGAGSIYVKGPTSIYGDLTVDNGGPNLQPTILSSLGSGSVTAVTLGNTIATNRSAIAAYFAGNWIEVSDAAGAVRGTWRIASINSAGSVLTLAANANDPVNVAVGDTWRGVYRFDNVRLRTSVLRSTDPVFITNPIDKDAGSQLITNVGAPQFPADKRAQIVVDSALTGDAVIGSAGAVIDPDTPIRLNVQNTRTLAPFFANANADGSFRVPVSGAVGDTFTISATDSSLVGNLTSATIPVNGTIVETNEVSALTLQPSAVTGGTTTFGSLRMAAAARANGITVGLASSNPAASVPATVFIPAGSATAQFPVTTTAVAATLDLQITATFMASTRSATLTVTPSAASLVDVSLAAATVEGGASVTGTVLLGAPAPPAGALVALASSSPSVTVPPNIFVAEGNTQASFSAVTSKISTATNATITATWGASDSVSLDITACAVLGAVAAPASMALDTVWSDEAAPTGAVTSGEAAFDATQAARGSLSLHFAPPTSTQQRTFSMTSATPLAVTSASEIVLYTLVNPCNPPRQILITWGDGTSKWSASFGESRFDPAIAPAYAGAVPRGGEWTRLSLIAKTIGITTNKNLTALTITVDGGEAWFDAIGATSCNFPRATVPSQLPNETVWFDDTLPAGAVAGGAFNSDTAQVASGAASFSVAGNGAVAESSFTGATSGLTLNVDDVIVAYVLVDPCNPPREVMLQFSVTGSFIRRAFWGEDLFTQTSTGGSRLRRMGPMPEGGKWIRLEIPASSMEMAAVTVNGITLDVYDGRAWFDRVGKVSRVNVAVGKPATQSSTLQGDPANNAGNANDGNTATTNASLTNNELQAWWQVDLGSVQPIDSIDVWGPSSSAPQKFYVLVSDREFTSTSLDVTRAQEGVSSYYYLSTAGRPTPFEIRRTGRYVRVQLAGQNLLRISEVQVWAPVTPGLVNISGGKSASQKSTFSDFGTLLDAAQAVNGNETSSKTLSEAGAWWEVDLGSIQSIDTIDIDNAFSNFSAPETARLSNFYLFVSNEKIPDTNSVAATLALSDVSAYYRGAALSAYTYRINRAGRYVRLQLTGTNNLQAREVRIWSPSLTIGALAKSPEAR